MEFCCITDSRGAVGLKMEDGKEIMDDVSEFVIDSAGAVGLKTEDEKETRDDVSEYIIDSKIFIYIHLYRYTDK